MNKITIFLFLITLLNSCKNKGSGSLSLVLINDDIKIKNFYRGHLQPCLSMCADIRYKIENTSSQNFLLYNFNRNFNHGDIEDSLYCQYNKNAGIAVFVYQKNTQKIAMFTISDSINWKPYQQIQEMLENEHQWYKKTKLVANSGESYNFKKKIDFWAFNLTPGEYTLKILYYQKNLHPYVDTKQIDKDKASYDAKIFQGYLWSNPIRLTVE